MSPAMQNFFHEFAAAAQALERLPLVEQDLTQVRAANESLLSQLQSREESILRLKGEIEVLQQRVRDAEVSRDDAELRFLELDEKVGKVVAVLGTVSGMVTDVGRDLSPPAPVAIPSTEPFQGMIGEASDPFGDLSSPSGGESPLAPSVHTSDGPSDAPSVPAPNVDAGTTGMAAGDGSVGQSASPPTPPYSQPPADQPPLTADNPPSVHGAETSPGTAPTESGSLPTQDSGPVETDPEPMPRFTNMWYDWRDRQREKAAAPYYPRG